MNYRSTYFPKLEPTVYLNHAAISPLNIRCTQAMEETMSNYASQGVRAWGPGNQARIAVRQKLARLIGAEHGQIALTSNTSQGLILVANEYPWRKGDSLILVRGEFPGNILPWLYAARRYELEIIWLDLDDILYRTERFEEAMSAQPRLLSISWVQYQTGRTVPLSLLADLRDTYDIHICLDAIQGLGPLQMDLSQTPLDFVSCGAHKWLLSPEGTAFLYVNPRRMESMNPTLVSWISQEDAASFLFLGAGYVDYDGPLKQNAMRYESATMNAVGFAGTNATLDLFFEVGPKKIAERIRHLADLCREGFKELGLQPIDDHSDAGNVCVPMEAERLKSTFKALDQRDIVVSTPDGHLRAAPHFYNSEEDIAKLLQGLREVLPR